MGKSTIRCSECGRTAQLVLPSSSKAGDTVRIHCSKCNDERTFEVV